MKRKLLFALFLTLATIAGQTGLTNAAPKSVANQDWMPCTVNDPTGTPLNVRAKPNGRVLTTLKNGTLVAIDDSTAGNKWARISVEKGRKTIIGWVLRDYLSCG